MQVMLEIMSLQGEKRYSLSLFSGHFFRIAIVLKNVGSPSHVAAEFCISCYEFLNSTHIKPKFPFLSHITPGSAWVVSIHCFP